MEYFFVRLEVLTELYDIVRTIGGGVKPMDDYLFLPPVGKRKLDGIGGFVVGESLTHPGRS